MAGYRVSFALIFVVLYLHATLKDNVQTLIHISKTPAHNLRITLECIRNFFSTPQKFLVVDLDNLNASNVSSVN